jgi:2-polyprenyl-6-hydroxyphenyl methylase / 3-demethylubiquinone-9 3-methyltransferase
VSPSVDNDVYNRIGETWWEEDSPLAFLHGSMTTGRMQYFRAVLTRLGGLPTDERQRTALDVGSGGGFLAEEFCRLGFAVTGVDPSEVSVSSAAAHAARSGLEIDYRVGTGEALPVEAASADVAYCSDVLEHVQDVDQVLAETARALKPGGIYLFDTLNRTLLSKVLTEASQQWRLTRVIDFTLHDWTAFLRPDELADHLHRHGLTMQETVGLGPRAKPWTVAGSIVQLRRGRLSYRQLSERLEFGRVRFKSLSYMGFAQKQSTAPHHPATG